MENNQHTHDLRFSLWLAPMRRAGLGRAHHRFAVPAPQVEQLRTGHWEFEHFLAYLTAVSIVCLGLDRSSWP
jgi:hypothetical protein